MKINLGCGEVLLKGWVNIDTVRRKGVKYGLAYPLDVEEKSCDIIYASHLLDYYDREEAVEVLKHWYLKLKKGGILRLAVPDFAMMAGVYLEKRVRLGFWELTDKPIYGPLTGRIDNGNGGFIFHKSWWDEYELTAFLNNAGFEDVRRWDCKKTRPHSKNRDCSWSERCGESISLNLEGSK